LQRHTDQLFPSAIFDQSKVPFQMLATNFYLKYVLYRLMPAGYQLLVKEPMQSVGERAIRTLAAYVNYIENNMFNTLGLDKRDPPDYALAQAPIEAHFLKFGAGGMIRDVASSKPGTAIRGFDSFDSLPLAGGESTPGRGAFLRDGNLPRIPANVVLHKGGSFSDTIRPWTRKVIRRMSNRMDQGR
jgi:hypothetical protein